MPRVAANNEPMTVVAMQYWLEAGIEFVVTIAQTGKLADVIIDKMMRANLRPYLRVLMLAVVW